mmetsp:Transcript_18323/g.25836  ORF Transcript_18323/g.25836 Transcript_18323/m.25836 type:complete len:334 (-) Transcript_18323:299-1300(-)
MCKAETTMSSKADSEMIEQKVPIKTVLPPPSLAARYTCASILMGVFAVWGKYTFVPESEAPGIGSDCHSYRVPLALTVGYLVSLPLLRWFVDGYLSRVVDVKLLLKESMVLYNVSQVVINGWMVYRFIQALYRGHPFVGDTQTVASGATYAIWVHYCDKYLEFLDTYFMVLRGRMDQVSFLHVYHHTTIAWAWWAAFHLWPGGDAYFGALCNSWIHVMMYSYYALALLKIPCPWKKSLTLSQLIQFATVNAYTLLSCWKIYEIANWKHYTAYAIQITEMTSLFILFSHFYRKTYQKKEKVVVSSKDDSESKSSSVPEQESVASTTDSESDSAE